MQDSQVRQIDLISRDPDMLCSNIIDIFKKEQKITPACQTFLPIGINLIFSYLKHLRHNLHRKENFSNHTTGFQVDDSSVTEILSKIKYLSYHIFVGSILLPIHFFSNSNSLNHKTLAQCHQWQNIIFAFQYRFLSNPLFGPFNNIY